MSETEVNGDKPFRRELNATRQHDTDYRPPWVGDSDAEEGRSIAENDALQAEWADDEDKESHVR